MIVPMKRIALVMQAKDAQESVKRLRKLGLLHLEHTRTPAGRGITAISEDILLLDRALAVLVSAFPQAKADTLGPEQIDAEKIATHIIDIKRRQDQLREYSLRLRQDIDRWREWGDFEPGDILALKQKNIYFGFYQIPASQLERLSGDFVLKKLKRQGSLVNCLIISLGPADLPYKELELPRSSLSASLQRIAKDKKVLAALNAGLERYAVYYQELLLAKRKLQKELEFHQALEGMGEDAGLTYIKGFVPIDAQEALADCARKEKWAILVSDPADEYNVPVLLRNPRWVALINPLFKFLEILPGYSELDISLPFLIFFSLFFGILIGDAGYGTIYALATFIFQRKLAKRKVKPDTFYLFYILSFCSIAFGLLSGTFFGQEWLGKIGFKPLLPALNNPHHIQAVCFFIGAIHLTIAHSWRFILKMPSWAALADLGWMAVLWTSFFLAKTLVLGDSFPLFGKWLLACGISLVIFFTNPNKNILKGVGEGLGTLALSLMNNFTDVVSYIRLFAVGLAGIAIADAFNAMAALVGFQNVLAIIVSVLILLIGHTLGIVLGPVSVLVHGVRLNVLEFSGHANVTWSGESYRPFKEGT